MIFQPSVAVAVLLVLVLYIIRRPRARTGRASLPPGPKGYPIIGNLFDWPSDEHEGPWVELSRLANSYGDIMYFNIFGTSIVVLSSHHYATELLTKKGRIYSDRPKLTMAGKLVGWENDGILQQYGETWLKMRKHFSNWTGTPARVAEYEDLIRSKALHLANSIRSKKLNRHEEWTTHCSNLASGIMLNLVYGKEPSKPENKKLSEDVKRAQRQISEMMAPNGYIVDTFPMLRFAPSWFPGAGWKKKVPFYRQTLHDSVHVPYQQLKHEWANETQQADSFLARELASKPPMDAEEEYILTWAASTLNSGGTDTTTTSIETFFVAICLHPSGQATAQAELDQVLGKGVIATLADRPSLPYVEAFFKEVLRLYGGTAAALGGAPHVLSEDDVYEVYFIPKGTVVFANFWRFMRDPFVYSNPYDFRPERFLGPNPELDPKTFLFGYGRRACPGSYLADVTMWLTWSTILVLMDVRSPDEREEAYARGLRVATGKYTTNDAIGHPQPFDFIATPRS